MGPTHGHPRPGSRRRLGDGGIHQRDIHRMAAQIYLHEGAAWYDPPAFLPRIGQCCTDERAANAVTGQRWRNFGVQQNTSVAGAVILERGEEAIVLHFKLLDRLMMLDPHRLHIPPSTALQDR